jgi:hypothetical protein
LKQGKSFTLNEVPEGVPVPGQFPDRLQAGTVGAPAAQVA